MTESPTESPTVPPPDDEATTHRRPSPLLWVLLVVALLALAWYFLGGRGAPGPEPAATIPAPVAGAEGDADAATDVDAATGRPDTRRPATATTPATGPTRAAQPVARLQPDYPREAFRAGEQGRVLLSVQVGADGVPTDVQVAESSRSRDLDRAAVEAVRKWRFEPALDNGQAVASTVQVPIDFTLQ